MKISTFSCVEGYIGDKIYEEGTLEYDEWLYKMNNPTNLTFTGGYGCDLIDDNGEVIQDVWVNWV